jgi:hypothetical protein
MSSPSGQRFSPRYNFCLLRSSSIISHFDQALEGKDIKDLLLNVGSGGGAPAAGAASGAAAGGDAAAVEAKEEEKEEGRLRSFASYLGAHN